MSKATPATSILGRPSAVHLKPSAFHLGPPLLATSQPQGLDLSDAVSPCISSGQRSTKPRLWLRARHSLFVSSLLGRPFSTPSAAYRRPSIDSPLSSPSATIFTPTHLSTRLACCSVAPRAPLADRLRISLALRSIPILFARTSARATLTSCRA